MIEEEPRSFFDRGSHAISARTLGSLVLAYLGGQILFFQLTLLESSELGLFLFFLATGACLGAACWITLVGNGWSPIALGLRRVENTWLIWSALLGPIVLLGTIFLGMLLSPVAQENLANYNSELVGGNGLTPFIFSVVTLVILVPFAEELLFRGAIFNYLSERLGDVVGWLGSSVLFALAHSATLSAADGFIDQLVMISVLSLVGLAALWVRVKTGSLFPAVTLHGSYNASVLLIQVSLP